MGHAWKNKEQISRVQIIAFAMHGKSAFSGYDKTQFVKCQHLILRQGIEILFIHKIQSMNIFVLMVVRDKPAYILIHGISSEEIIICLYDTGNPGTCQEFVNQNPSKNGIFPLPQGT